MTRAVSLLGSIAIAATACGSSSTFGSMEALDTTHAEMIAASASAPRAPSVDAFEAESATLNDPQILDITHAANAAEIAQSSLAAERAIDARVKRFAAMILRDHRAADDKAREIAGRLNVTPLANTVSASLATRAKTHLTTIESAQATDFDHAYMDAQITAHTELLQLIDHRIMPCARSREVVELVHHVRPTVAQHLKSARDIKRELQPRVALFN